LDSVVPRVSLGILEVNDPIFKSLPSTEKSKIIASAYCTYVTGKGLEGACLYDIVCAMNGSVLEDLPNSIIVKIPDNTSVKRLSHHTASTTHTILWLILI
jgi:hypothetical protein